MSRCDCCGCQFADDYGTSTVSGSGTSADPFTVTRVDPAFVRPAVRVTGGTVASVPNQATPLTVVPFNTEVFDTDNMWVIGSPTRLTLQRTGFYVFGAEILWPSNATGNRIMEWRHTPISGSGAVALLDNRNDAPSGDYSRQLNYQWYFTAGDYLELYVGQVSGGALNMTSSIAWAVYIGRKT